MNKTLIIFENSDLSIAYQNEINYVVEEYNTLFHVCYEEG